MFNLTVNLKHNKWC